MLLASEGKKKREKEENNKKEEEEVDEEEDKEEREERARVVAFALGTTVSISSSYLFSVSSFLLAQVMMTG